MRLHALEQRIEADLALGRHALLVAELEQLAGEHPLRERFLAQLMLALYRSGRQPEALDVYHRARRLLVDELGIEPTASLRSLERSILSQDPELDLFEAVPGSPAAPDRVLVVASNDRRIGALLAIAEPLARLPGHELIIARLVEREDELEQAVSAATTSRQFLEVPARAAAFTTDDAAADILRMARDHDVELILEDAPPGVDAPTLPAELVKMLERSPADVGLLAGSGEWAADDGIFVPFAGGEHDWAALELSAWLAAGTGAPLRLLGTKPAPAMGGRDASRLLADASLAVQQVFGVEARPLLAHPSEDGLLDAVEPAAIVVVGFSERWRQQGVGESRRTLLRRARPPILLVHRGPKPGGLAPREARTRFSWTVGYRYLQGVSFAPR
jgi:hypothetical protein